MEWKIGPIANFLHRQFGLDLTPTIVGLIFALFLWLAYREIKKNRSKNKPSPEIIEASIAGNLERVQALLANSADINAQNASGETALMYAIANHKNDVVKYLIESGAKTNLQSKNGKTALDYAQKFENLVAENLLRACP